MLAHLYPRRFRLSQYKYPIAASVVIHFSCLLLLGEAFDVRARPEQPLAVIAYIEVEFPSQGPSLAHKADPGAPSLPASAPPSEEVSSEQPLEEQNAPVPEKPSFMPPGQPSAQPSAGAETGEGKGGADPAPADTLSGGKGSNEAFSISSVDERPQLLNGKEMQKLLARLYPPELRRARISGSTVVQFVIGTTGEVEEQSIKVIRADHEEWMEPSVLAARALKFKPAKLQDTEVRVLIDMPLLWKLKY